MLRACPVQPEASQLLFDFWGELLADSCPAPSMAALRLIPRQATPGAAGAKASGPALIATGPLSPGCCDATTPGGNAAGDGGLTTWEANRHIDDAVKEARIRRMPQGGYSRGGEGRLLWGRVIDSARGMVG